MTPTTTSFAVPPATLRLGDLEVTRLGFGAMRLPGKDVWGEPDDPARARAVVRRAVELGMNLIDTALPYFPLLMGQLGDSPALAAAAERHGATPAQLALAWLLARSPVMLPIPGTGSLEHLEENWAARTIALSPDEITSVAASMR